MRIGATHVHAEVFSIAVSKADENDETLHGEQVEKKHANRVYLHTYGFK